MSVPALKPAAVLPKHQLLPNGLRLQPGLSFEEWAALGGHLGSVQNATSWALGDWFFYGEWEYGSRYEEAAAATGLAYQTLADLKYVAGRFEFSRRRETLSLSHHREVAPLELGEQDRWLDLAVEQKWSRESLRQAIAGRLPLELDEHQPLATSSPATAPRPMFVELVIVVTPAQQDAWTAAAGDVSLEEWVRDVCDAAA